MTKILLDTDIGTDVDDAVCLAYLLSHPQCELLGITTVTGEAVKRASLASVLCKAAGQDVPIYPGAEHPLHGKQRQPIAQQAATLSKWPNVTEFPMNQAVEFLANTILRFPDEVILLTIGPLTNIGKLFHSYPDVAKCLAGLVIMGGSFGDKVAANDRVEWNIACDPFAAQIIYQTPVHLHRSVGLNVTRQLVMPADDVRSRFSAPLLHPVLDMAEIWFASSHPHLTFHDPLAAATIFEPELCFYQQGKVKVSKRIQPGRTKWQPGSTTGPHQVAMSVDVDCYFDHFFSIVGQ